LAALARAAFLYLRFAAKQQDGRILELQVQTGLGLQPELALEKIIPPLRLDVKM